jgi:hypothetical protein
MYATIGKNTLPESRVNCSFLIESPSLNGVPHSLRLHWRPILEPRSSARSRVRTRSINYSEFIPKHRFSALVETNLCPAFLASFVNDQHAAVILVFGEDLQWASRPVSKAYLVSARRTLSGVGRPLMPMTEIGEKARSLVRRLCTDQFL